jgi:hypothetical protein
MHIEAKPAFAPRNVEIETTVAQVQVPRRAEGIVDRAQDLPVLSEGEPGLLGAMIGRAEAQVIRLALIYALFDRCAESTLDTCGRHSPSGSSAKAAWQRGLRRLDICRPPEGVPCDRWRTFVAAAARFLASPFAERASALGWTALDLFGCEHSRPLARLDRAGLIWLLNGQKLIALTAETAVVRARTGARQTYRRSRKPTQVLAWELN